MKPCDILITDTTLLVSTDTIKQRQDIAISNGSIVEVGSGLSKKYMAKESICGKRKVFLPGLIDSHIHTGQQLLKGGILDAAPVIWTRIMLPFESSLTPEKMRLSGELAALEMIKSGTTAFVESGSYHMSAAAEVYAASGLRGALSASTMDDAALPPAVAMDGETALRQTDALFDRFHKKGNLKVYYSLRALNACSLRLTEGAIGRAREKNTYLQAHMNEYPQEIRSIQKREGLSPYAFLNKLGGLSPNFLGVHSLILTEEEKGLIAENGVKLCHCPFSNCGKALPPTPELLQKNISVGLGSDGAAHGGLSLWSEIKIFRSIMQLGHGVPQGNSRILPASAIFHMVWEGGAAALDETGNLGRIEVGQLADLISVNLDQPHLFPTNNLLHTLLESAQGKDVADMIVNGKILMKDRTVLSLDEEKILYSAKRHWEKNR